MSRLPDFIIIGAMKSGTTTLYRWLGTQPEIALGSRKEPHFFSREENWLRGADWYRNLFPPHGITGEASASYTDPMRARIAAERMASLVPDTAVVYIVRHPVERLRSHFRHALQEGSEERSLPAALMDHENPYVGHSLYYRCLEPYLEAFPRDRICVVRFEDVVYGPALGWQAVLAHLGLSARPAPGTRHYEGAAKRQYPAGFLRLWRSGRLPVLGALPTGVKRSLRAAASIGSSRRGKLHEVASQAPIPAQVLERIWDDVSKLERLLATSPLWRR